MATRRLPGLQFTSIYHQLHRSDCKTQSTRRFDSAHLAIGLSAEIFSRICAHLAILANKSHKAKNSIESIIFINYDTFIRQILPFNVCITLLKPP